MRFIKTAAVAALGAMVSSAVLAAPAPAAELAVSQCWIRLLPGKLPSGGYFKVVNPTAQSVELVGASTPAFGMAMLHQTRTEGGTARMEMVDSVSVPAKGSFSFAPGNYHLMLEQPAHVLSVGSSIPVQFTFRGGLNVTADCSIKSAGATGP